jgi:CheY-like chemotaxis protein
MNIIMGQYRKQQKEQVLHMETGISGTLQKNVLIVDDDEAILKLISYWMTFREWNVTTACNGVEAFDRVSEEKKFPLILTDFNMPQMDGLTLAEKIKDIYPFVRIILITGIRRDIIEKENKIAFIDNVLYKPFSLKELDRVVGLFAPNERDNRLHA